MRTLRKSAGTLCTAPGEIAFLLMDFILLRYAVGLGVLGRPVMPDNPSFRISHRRFAHYAGPTARMH
jgi:hypothetical protein